MVNGDQKFYQTYWPLKIATQAMIASPVMIATKVMIDNLTHNTELSPEVDTVNSHHEF